MRSRITALSAVASLLLCAAPAHAQEASDVLAGLRAGGGWVSIPIENGVGSVRTLPLPAMGMTVSGCLTIWPGHSGRFEIRAHEIVADSTLVVTAEPGVGIPFSHTFGMQARVDVDVRWTEPRDTTLMMWVGLAIGKTVEEACEPVYGRRAP